MTNKFLLNLLGFNPDLTSRQSRVDSVSILSRQSDLLTYLGRIAAILLLVLTIGSGNVWGATATFTPAASGGWTTTAGAQSGTVSGITVAVTNGVLNYSKTEMRFYSGATMTISGATITQIVFTHSGGTLSLKAGSPGSYNSSTKTWTGSGTSIQFSNNAQVKFTQIVVTYGGSTPVTGVSVSPTSKSIVPGETFTITPTISPAGATDKVVSWTSSATSKATVSSAGVVTGVAAGSSTITCTTHDGSYTATCAVTVRSVTLQALDEDGNAIGVGGPGAPTRSGATITAAANAGNYVFKQWDVTNATVAASGTTPTTISNPTGAVTVTAVYYKPITITYKANGSTFTTQTYARGGTLAFPNSNPDGATYSCTGKTFVGWAAEANKNYSHASTPPTYATAGGSVTEDATYYAVFATATPGDDEEVAYSFLTADDAAESVTAGWGITNTTNSYAATYGATWLRNNNASLPIFTFSPSVDVSKIVLKLRQSNTTGSNTVACSVGGNTIATNSMPSNSSQFDMTFEPASASSGQIIITCTNTSGSGTGKGSFYVASITLTQAGTTYSNYETNCCTPLGSINGSISLTQGGNSVTISGWSDVSNTGTYTVKMYKKNGASWDLVSGTASNGNAGTAGTRTNIATDSKSVTYTGLVVESEYKFTVQAIAGSASYCDGDETEVTTINSTSVSSTPFKFRYAIYIDDGTNDNYEYHYITPTGNTDEGSVDIDLNAHVDYYQFKIAGGFSGWWGQTGTDGKIEATTVSDWTLNGSYNVRLKTGAAGDYVFTVDYSGTTNPKVGVEYPSADQDAGYVIYYDNSILNWSSLYYRIGNNSNCSKVDAVLVTGTDKFYKITTPDYDNMDAWHIANNYGWTGSNSVYRTKTNSTPAEAAKAITNSISFQQYVVTGDITVIPTTTHSTGGDTGDAGNNNCEFYTINTPTSGMLTHTATITAPSNGTINLAYTNTSGTSCPTNTSTVSSLAHRTKLTATATPSTGYKVTAFTVTPSGDDAIDLSGDNGETDNHILAKDATFAATFSAKQSAITFDKNSGTGGSDGATGTYGSALPDITAPTRTGYSFGGYYDAETDNNGSGTQYYNANGKSAHNWDKDTEAASTLYANWSANTTTITLNANGGIENKEATIKYDAATYTTFTAVQKVGHTCNGYWTGSGGTGTKILNADGSFAGDNITVSTTVYTNGGKWAYTAASTLTLYAGWTNTYGGDEFELVLDLSELSAGKKIVILDKDYATAISTTQQSNNRASVAAGAADNAGFAMSEGNTVVTLGTATTVQVITLESTGTANRYYMNVENGYFYAPGTSTNYLLRTRANNSSYADQGQFNFALSNGDFTISAQSSTNKYLRKNTSSALFSCYANAGDQKAVLVYVKRESCDAPGTALSLSASSTNISTATGYNTSTLSTTGGNGGTVYYRVTSSNKANATIAGTSFSATAAGTYTVMAYQLKNGSKCRQISTVDITVTTPTLTVNKTSYDFGKKATGGTYTNSSITITGANLVGDISLSGVSGALSVSPTSVTAASAMAGAQTITITWEPTTAGALNQTLTFSSTGAADKTVTITGTGADYYNVTWNISGNDPIVVSVESGTKPTFPTPSPTSCDGTSTTFIGWTQTKWTGKLTQTQIDAKTAADVKVYKSSSDLPTVSAAIDYYAVWAKQEMESDEIVSSLTATALSGSNSTTWVTINSLDAPTTDATYKIYSMGTYKSGTNPKQYETYVMKWSSSNGYLQTNSVPSSGNKLLSVTVLTQTGIGNKSVGVSGSNNGSDWTSCGSLTATEAGGTYEFTSSYTWIKLTGAASSSLLESVTITYGSYSDYLTTCCESSGLEFSTTEQEVIREDLGGNKATHKVIYFPYTTSSGGTLSAEVKRMSTYGSRDEAAAGYSASTYTSVEVDETNNRVVLEVWSVNDPTTSGQWTYRVKLHQDATDALSGNYCATDDYSFVDVILRDKFVDAVNGNATINRDGKGVALNTPAESDMDVEKDDDCGGQTRRLLGWIRETDLETIYGSLGETGYLEGAAAYEANKDKIVAPGNGSFITTGCTWYAVWGVDNTPEP